LNNFSANAILLLPVSTFAGDTKLAACAVTLCVSVWGKWNFSLMNGRLWFLTWNLCCPQSDNQTVLLYSKSLSAYHLLLVGLLTNLNQIIFVHGLCIIHMYLHVYAKEQCFIQRTHFFTISSTIIYIIRLIDA